MTAQVKVSAILLCAGQSSRMAGDNKLLMEFDSESVVQHASTRVSQARFHHIVAVTGYESDRVAQELAGRENIRVVYNADYKIGMHSSLRAGLLALDPSSDFFAVCLADQPLLTKSDYDFLIGVAEAHPSALLIAPRYAGLRGSPTVISMRLRDEILAYPDSDRGAVYLFERYPDFVVYVDMPNAQHSLDVDTRDMMKTAKEVLNGNA